jgi:polysaccharide export outer membrane protein
MKLMHGIKVIWRTVAAALLFGLSTAALAQVAGGEARAPYTLNPGDVLVVTVWKEEDLARQVLIRPDGSFSFPLAGEILAEGRSVPEIQAQLVERLSAFIPEPEVSVSTEQLAGNKVYVIGQVNRPGEFVVTANVDVLQALSIAGGTTPFAQVNDIKIMRRENGVLRDINFKYGDIEKGKRLEQNIVLKPGDVVVVP